MSKKQAILRASIAALLVVVLGVWLGTQFLRALGAVFGAMDGILGEETAQMLGEIFSAMRRAHIIPPVLIPLLICALYFALLLWIARGKRKAIRCTLFVLVTLIVLWISFAASVALSRVNDVRFLDFLKVLLRVLQAGLLDM